MIYDATLLIVIGLTAWIAMDIVLDRVRRKRLGCVVLLAMAAFCWAAGELMVRHANTPAQVLAWRRILFAGVCTLPAAWVWSALAAAHPEAPARSRKVFFLLLVPSMIFYSSLYVAPGGV